ncbi:MAG: hypothetical protein MUF84_05060 [Anaerolineae bacterium]|jgi:cation:H+ antiporter|nr:hypothetical protein [Anaerolineae bacterium]
MFETSSTSLLTIVGLVSIALLVISAEFAVRKLIGLAGYFRLSTTFMGVTVVSLATSIPEIAAHLTASVGILAGAVDYNIASAVVLGANIGSDVVQQTLIMAIVVLLAGKLVYHRYFLAKTMLPMVAATLLCLALGWDRHYSRIDGMILVGSYIAYLYYLYVDERKHYDPLDNGFDENGDAPEGAPSTGKQAWRAVGIALACFAVTVASAMVTLSITEVIVVRTGIGGSLIGVLTLGVASALPELITAVSGIRRGDTGIPLGTLIGSNITNPLVAIGVGAVVSTYWAPGPLVLWDLPWQAITGAMLWAYLWFHRGTLGKRGALYLIALYFAYVTLRSAFYAVD